MFEHESFVLACFLRISKYNVWVSQSASNEDPKSKSAFMLKGKVGHSTVLTLCVLLSHAHIFKLTKHSILNTIRV